MDDAALIETLRQFGIDQDSFQALSLLPLVQVAWADGEVQREENDLILELAERKFQLGTEGRRTLTNWLMYRPTSTYHAQGQELLVALARRQGRVSIDTGTLDEVIALAGDVAAAAGGLWGFMAVDRQEVEALSEVADALHLSPEASWSDVMELDEDADTEEVDAEVAFHVDATSVTDGYLVRSDNDDATRCPVPTEGLNIGRGRNNGVQVMESSRVSREHCCIHIADGRFYLRDLDSTTGTVVNGERIHERRLFGGETVEVGGVAFRFEIA